ncbi:uncharacterized protein Z518_08515 [Rhinocladiella mackenziei CBS 650.93]|uniref:VOC domain-containing protein n=1 Tax=Rhinocladiella mackenziei CBS 650.93 TaxID=1442369 RepID=A0A0D2I9N7_9EURO|nr:uncharacterized protein Z518_08515 [Rhinocladiella mackenziei CBS 650.93]KIX02574.1 hypothetical protein Z518_08515 [Rhinocladiella mackenziei CBS 650.93]
MLREKNNSQGLIELQYLRNSTDNLTASTVVTNTFSHIGLVVPDVNKTQTRMEKFGIEILKRVDVVAAFDSPTAYAFGLSTDAVGDNMTEANNIMNGVNRSGLNIFFIIADPDGNVLEIQQQN